LDGSLDIKLGPPGPLVNETNPEQLFAAAWSASFGEAMALAADGIRVELPRDARIDAEIDLCVAGTVYFLEARLKISLPGIDGDVAQALADAAHRTCPYSSAVRGNVTVVIDIV